MSIHRDYSPCIAKTPSRRRYATPAQARAHERGYADFPRFIERGVVAYSLGYHEAEQREDAKRDDRREAQDYQRQREERGL